MLKITFRLDLPNSPWVEAIKGIEGTYKSELIAKRHLRKLKKKYPETKFKLNVV